MRAEYLDTIKRFEGFNAKANWDYAQYSNGYGTRARHAGETIDRVEAEQRFRAEIMEAHAAVRRFAPGLDEGTAAALASLTFNAGPGWMRSGLGDSIKAGDIEAAKQAFESYVYAGGQKLPGLIARRAAEAEWIGSTPAPPQANGQADPPALARPAVTEALAPIWPETILRPVNQSPSDDAWGTSQRYTALMQSEDNTNAMLKGPFASAVFRATVLDVLLTLVSATKIRETDERRTAVASFGEGKTS